MCSVWYCTHTSASKRSRQSQYEIKYTPCSAITIDAFVIGNVNCFYVLRLRSVWNISNVPTL